MNRTLLRALRVFGFDAMVPAFSIAAGVGMAFGDRLAMGVFAALAVFFFLANVATSPRKGDEEYQPFGYHVAVAFASYLLFMAVLFSLFATELAVMGAAIGLAGTLLTAAMSMEISVSHIPAEAERRERSR